MADSLVRTLNGLGYQPVFLARSGIKPPELYSYLRQQRRLVRLGALTNFLPAGTVLPPSTGQLGNIQTEYKTDKSFDGAISFLEQALLCIGVGAVPSIDLGFAGSREFSFAFAGVQYASVDPADLYPVIGGFEPKGLPREYLEDGRLHIAYEYAYASELLMSRGDKQAFSADVGGKLGEYFKIGAKGSVSLASKTTISFKGDPGTVAAFAYKAGRLEREHGHWTFYPEEVSKAGLTETRQPFVAQRAVALTVEEG